MIRIITQILLGLMLLFGTVTLTPRLLFHLKTKNFARALYFLLMWLMSLFFAILAFHSAYSGLTEL